MNKVEMQEELKQYRISVENLSKEKKEILSEFKRYKKGFDLVMEHFDSWDEEQKKTIHKQLLKIDL
jgi:soluble cytochrome b562